MAEQDPNILLGRLAVHYKVLDKEQAQQAIRRWRSADSGTGLAEFLVEESYVPAATMEKLERARGEYLRRQETKTHSATTKTSPPEPPAAPQPGAPQPGAPQPAAPQPATPQPATPQPAAPPPGATTVRLTPEILEAAEAMAAPAATPPAAAPVDDEPLLPPPADDDLLVPPGDAPEPASVAAKAPEPAPVAAASPEPEPEPEDAAEPEPEDAAAFTSVTAGLDYAPGVSLDELLRRACAMEASDLHVHSGAPLKIRLHGELRDASAIIDREAAKELVYGILTPEQRARLEEHLQIDFSHTIPGVGRFRSNSYFQHRGLDGVFRIIPPRPPTLESLGLPDDLRRFSEYHQGMVLFTGPAGCGKSSTMAAMVRLINESRPEHILTIEDPIEYVHEPDRCVVNQREVGPHTGSFGRALRAALREDPDIIIIGELRDLETIQLALTAAETGHLVLGTLHTASTVPTLNRLVGVFPPDQQAQIRTMVSESLRAIVSQRLVPRIDGAGRVPALEILINNKAIGNLIRDNRTFQINSLLQTGGTQGMCQLDASLAALVKDGVIAQDVARREAIDPKRFA